MDLDDEELEATRRLHNNKKVILFKNIKVILELCEKELIRNNKETFATLDYEDLLELQEMYNQIEKFYEGELYTAKQMRDIEKNQKEYFINKQVIKDKIEGRKTRLTEGKRSYTNKIRINELNLLKRELLGDDK